MTITCPSCDTRFRQPPEDALVLDRMQCSRCDHIFTRAQGERIVVDAPSVAPGIGDLVGNLEGTMSNEIRVHLPVVVEGEPASTKPAPLYVDRAEEDVPPLFTKLGALSMAALTLVLALCGTILFRQAIAQAYPATVAYYDALGMTLADPNLAIASVVTSRSESDGITKLIVRGEIRNVADDTVPVPPLNIVMRNGAKSTVYQWQASAAKSELKSGERSRFTAIASNVPGDAVDVEVTFAK